MSIRDFEDFLKEKHGEQYVGTGDMMPEDYEKWLSEQDIDAWIIWGDMYKSAIKSELKEKIDTCEVFTTDRTLTKGIEFISKSQILKIIDEA